jgi:hypothetical protein
MIKQYAKIFTNLIEVDNFIVRNSDEPWFEVIDLKTSLAWAGAYLAERYVVLYRAQEPLA